MKKGFRKGSEIRMHDSSVSRFLQDLHAGANNPLYSWGKKDSEKCKIIQSYEQSPCHLDNTN